MTTHLCLFFLLLPFLPARAQDLPYARMIVDSLASPEFGGRGYDGDADGRAAAFVERQFIRHGLLPVFDGLEQYEQPFSFPFDTFLETPRVAIDGVSLRIGLDALPYAATPSGEGRNIRVVNAGSGLALPELEIDEYQGLDVQGSAVLIDDRIADSIRSDPRVQAPALSLSNRMRLAASQGAQAFLLVTDNLSYGWAPENAPIPTFVVRRDALPATLNSLDYSVRTALDSTVTTTNVAGVLPGLENPREYLMVTAHYDHLGRLGDDVYFPGANDNASGTAMLLTLARSLSTYKNRYSIVFVAFSGEEQGLRGSRYFVENPPFPLESIRFLVNLDMVASGEDGLVAVGGSDFAEEFDLLSALNDSLEFRRLGKRSNAPNSDQYFFLQKGVRGFFIYTNKGTQPYHHPMDVPETLDWGDFEDAFRLVRRFLTALDRG